MNEARLKEEHVKVGLVLEQPSRIQMLEAVNLLVQWAAVRTQLLVRRVPEQP